MKFWAQIFSRSHIEKSQGKQGCIFFRIPPREGGGNFFQVIWEDFQVEQVGKEDKGRERRKGDEKTKREKKKGRKRDKRG